MTFVKYLFKGCSQRLPVDELECVLVEVVDELLEVGIVGLGGQALPPYPLYLIPGINTVTTNVRLKIIKN